MISTKKRKAGVEDEDLLKNWREVLGNPPKRSDGLKVCLDISSIIVLKSLKFYLKSLNVFFGGWWDITKSGL